MNTEWQLPTRPLLEHDVALSATVEQVYRAMGERHSAGELMLNLALPVETRALRHLEDWRVMLLLTPWVFARLLLPAVPPALALPPGWSAAERDAAEPVVLGPQIAFTLSGTEQKAHLNFHPQLGHYLIQPLVLAMEGFSSPEEVYQAWNEVIRTRDENMRKMQRECPMQQEISRREFFSGLWQR